MMEYYDTSTELLTEDIRDMKHLLNVLQGVTEDNTMTDEKIKIAYARAIYHILAYAIRILERERRRNNA